MLILTSYIAGLAIGMAITLPIVHWIADRIEKNARDRNK